MKIKCKGSDDIHALIDEAMERPIRCCYWCGSRFRADPSEPARYCSQECSIDSKNLDEED